MQYNYKHGYSRHPLYRVWVNMRARCYRKSDPAYQSYGARGISICDEWRLSCVSFIKWSFANGWRKGLGIDRKNNNGDYFPDNCHFVPSIVNSNNRRIRSRLKARSLPSYIFRDRNHFRFEIQRKNMQIQVYCRTLQEAVEKKKNFLLTNTTESV